MEAVTAELENGPGVGSGLLCNSVMGSNVVLVDVDHDEGRPDLKGSFLNNRLVEIR